MSKDALGDRMKGFEGEYRSFLTPKVPVVIRLDGKAFHTFVRKLTGATKEHEMEGPFNRAFTRIMDHTASALESEIPGVIASYTQSDEISLLLKDWQKEETQMWFGGSVQKITSISAGIAVSAFITKMIQMGMELNPPFISGKMENIRDPLFDSRVFNVPFDEVYNYFIWRHQDCVRNSVSMYGQYHYSHRKLQGVGVRQLKEMLEADGNSWEDLKPRHKYGRIWTKTLGERNFPDLVQLRNDYSYTLGDLLEFIEDRTESDNVLDEL